MKVLRIGDKKFIAGKHCDAELAVSSRGEVSETSKLLFGCQFRPDSRKSPRRLRPVYRALNQLLQEPPLYLCTFPSSSAAAQKEHPIPTRPEGTASNSVLALVSIFITNLLTDDDVSIELGKLNFILNNYCFYEASGDAELCKLLSRSIFSMTRCEDLNCLPTNM